METNVIILKAIHLLSEYAAKIFDSGLIQKAFSVWLSAYQSRVLFHEKQDKITGLAEHFQKRRMFEHWRHCIFFMVCVIGIYINIIPHLHKSNLFQCDVTRSLIPYEGLEQTVY